MGPERAFDWDDAKAQSNLVKHGVPFPYAVRVFLDPMAVDLKEVRREAVGVIEGKLYVVVYVDRDDARRIISARRTNAMEQRAYGQI
jgi:uncharacterized DUF497 family protein